MRPSLVAVALCTVLATMGRAQPQGTGDIERLRGDLLQPGPEARLSREAAIEALLARKEPQAHAVLQEMLGRLADADDVTRTILAQLRRKLTNPADPVFGNQDRERSVARSYLPAFAGFFHPERQTPAAQGLHDDVRECLTALTPLDRRRGFEDLLKAEDAGQRTAALLAAARCRDLGLAPLIAPALDQEATAATAREALRLLTFAEPFATRQAFEEWWTANGTRTYVQLAEDAARRANDERAAAQRRADGRMAELLADLVEALATREDVPWAKIAERVLADDPRGSQRRCLERLRDVLARQPRSSGVAAERQDFLLRLRALSGGVRDAEQQALLLEVSAYLVLPTEEKLRTEVVAALVAALRSESAVVRRAALLGLARFPSAATTAEVVEAATAARQAGEGAVLSAALAALGASDWRAPGEPTLQPWLALVGGVLRDRTAPDALREAALTVLEKRNAEDRLLPEGFELASELAADAEQPPVIRERAMLMLVPYANLDEAQADRYVQAIVARLADKERRVRLKAAQLLQVLPKHRVGLPAWRAAVLDRAGARLVEEADEAVLRAVVNCLERQIDADNPDRGPVIIRFCTALEDLARGAVNGGRRALLLSALATQAATQGLEPLLWVRAAETMLVLNERRELRNVLERQRPLALLEREGVNPEVLEKALEVVVRTALLKPPAERWSDLQREARDALAAIERLDKSKTLVSEPAVRVLRLELLAGLGQTGEVLARGARELQEAPFTAAERAKVALLMARAHLVLDQVDRSVAMVEAGIPAAEAGDLLRLREDVAVALHRRGDREKALAWMVDILGQTPESDPAFARRFLRRVEIEFQLNPDLRLTTLQRLQEKEALFTGVDVPADLRKQYEELKRLIAGSKG